MNEDGRAIKTLLFSYGMVGKPLNPAIKNISALSLMNKGSADCVYVGHYAQKQYLLEVECPKSVLGVFVNSAINIQVYFYVGGKGGVEKHISSW